MKSLEEKIQATTNFYNKSINSLYLEYEQANMSPLHQLLEANLSPHLQVLDIGFGSGRDLNFLQKHGVDIWGVDPSLEFVKKAKQRFINNEDHFIVGSLPNFNLPIEFNKKFNVIILVAVWMHIPIELYEASIREVCSLLKQKAKVIISYSITPRIGESERFFEDVDRKLLQNLFEKYGCKKLMEATNGDGLNERSIVWKTEVYQNDQS